MYSGQYQRHAEIGLLSVLTQHFLGRIIIGDFLLIAPAFPWERVFLWVNLIYLKLSFEIDESLCLNWELYQGLKVQDPVPYPQSYQVTQFTLYSHNREYSLLA